MDAKTTRNLENERKIIGDRACVIYTILIPLSIQPQTRIKFFLEGGCDRCEKKKSFNE